MGETFEEGWCAVRWQTMPWSCALTAHHPCPDRSNTEGSCFSSLSQPLDLSPLAPLLSANHSPSTLSPLGPIPLPLSARFLNAVCALPPTIFAHPFCTDTAHWHSVLAASVAGEMAAPQLQCTDRCRSAVIAVVVH